MNHIEIEVKFYLHNAASIRKQIVLFGATSNGRIFEYNIRYDDNRSTLQKNRSLLRLRKDVKTTLTYKTKTLKENDQFKILKELEVDVSDFNIMNVIIESLGFQRKQIYEKWRETFILNETIICIDQMPFGDFLEIEGSMDHIKEVSSLINLDWDKRIILNYIQLFDIIKQDMDLPFNDVTFDNFKNRSVDLSKYQKQFEAGQQLNSRK